MATTTHAIEDVDKGPQLVAVVLVLLFLSTIPVVLRIYARLSTRPRTYGIDDTFLIASWVLWALWVACMLESVHYGAGRHVVFLTDAQVAGATEPRYFGNLATMSSSGLVKCSLVIQELRIFTGKRTRAALWCMLAVIIIYTTVCFFFSIFICTPISAFWEQDIYALPADSPVRCIDYNALYYAHTTLTILTDVGVFAVPLPALVALNLPVRHKIAACTLISFGSFGCIASAVRFYQLWWTIHFSRDSTWDQNNNIWATIELAVFVTCASVTGLKPLFDRKLGPLLGRCLGRGGSGSSSGGSRSPWVLPTTTLERRRRREPGSLPLSGGDDDNDDDDDNEGSKGGSGSARFRDGAGPPILRKEADIPRARLANEERGDEDDDDEVALRAKGGRQQQQQQQQQQRHSWHGSRRGSLIPLKDMRRLARTDLDIPAESTSEDDMAWNGLRQHPPC